MPFEQVKSGKTSPGGEGRVFAGTVTLSSGSATITYADLPGVDGDLPETPVIVATGQSAGTGVAVTSAGTTQATIDDGSGSSSDTVNVVIHEQGGD
jgi:hypothetical protein